ncbi:MAG: hypothetical protein LBC40_01475 [Dysgonamonadaceae bacterium]|jgi:hypothetical protein|nr:hypothetical protein [Dysgonamonadaceae bacterium]
MSSFLSYNHPSLVLGNIVDTRVLDLSRQINNCLQKIDAAQDRLNSLIMMRRSLDMSVNELSGLNVDVTPIEDRQKELNENISAAAAEYLSKRIENEKTIQELREAMSEPEDSGKMESPLNLSACDLKLRPFAAESLRMDSQYFSFSDNMQEDTIANVEKFIRSSTGSLGDNSKKVVQEVSSQISNQIKNHSIAGTLIITASCTHKYIGMLDPLVIDPDRAIAICNTRKLDSLQVISGACYGSNFTGMVHILNSSSQGSGDFEKLQSGLKDKLTIGAWLENASGGFGVNKDLLKDVMVFLSTHSVNCHISIISMGAIPSIKPHDLVFSLPQLSEVNESAIQKITGDYSSVASEASDAKRNSLHVNIHNARIQQLTRTLGKIEQEKMKILDIGTLIEAFENYIAVIGKSDGKMPVGVPTGFYIHELTRQEIADAWQNKYHPKKDGEKTTSSVPNNSNEKPKPEKETEKKPEKETGKKPDHK